jgi:2-methylcitrate dehydratase PrpD
MSEKKIPATKIVADFVDNIRFEDIPKEDVDHLKLDILDTLGCGIYGSTTPWGSMVTQYAVEAGGPKQSTIWCNKNKVHTSNAVLANGTLVHSSELDDTHQPTLLHPGSAIFTTALATAELVEGICGLDLLTATAAGYETAINVRNCMGKSLVTRGFNGTGVLGTIGAAATASKILGLDSAGIMNAIGIAGVYASGLQSSQRSMSKRTLQGRAAQQGILGAFLSKKGFTGPEVLEVEFGGFCSTLSDDYSLKLIENIGKNFTIHNIGFKAYPAGIGIHSALEALKKIMKKHQISPVSVEKIVVKQTPHAAKFRKGMGPDSIKPWTIDTALMSMHYAVACMVIDGEMFINQLRDEKIRNPKILSMAEKVEIIPSNEFEEIEKLHPEKRLITQVEVHQKGRILESDLEYYPRGTPQNPMTLEELYLKFRTLAKTVFDADRIEEIIDIVQKMEEVEDVTLLAEKLVK